MQLPIEWLPAAGAPEQLIVLLHDAAQAAGHDAGQGGAAMAPLAQVLRAAFPQAALLAPDLPHGSLHELDLDAALPPLWAWLRQQQNRLQLPPLACALAGFGQGAVLALETAVRDDGLAGRVLAFGGRFAVLPEQAPRHTTLHLFHGADDAVVPVRHARIALQRLARLQGDATLDIADGAGHELHPALLACAVHRLTHHIPLRTWQAALGAAPSTLR